MQGLNVNLFFGGSRKRFFSAFLEAENWTAEELQSLSDILEQINEQAQ